VKRAILYSTIICLVLSGCSRIDGVLSKFKKEKVTESIASEDLDPVEEYNKNFSNSGDSSNEFTFSEPKVTGVDKYTDIPVGTKTVNLYLGKMLYYTAFIPDNLQIVTDNNKYIYSTDRSLFINVLSVNGAEDLATVLNSKSTDSLNPNLVVTGEDLTGPRRAALHIVNDKALLVSTYDNDIAFDIVLKGLKECSYKTLSSNELTLDADTKVLTEFPRAYTGFKRTVDSGITGTTQRMYTYESGSLVIARQLRLFEDCIEELCASAIISAGKSTPEVIYSNDSLYYAELGDITFAAIRLNYNTSISCYGIGKEARFNIVEFVNEQ